MRANLSESRSLYRFLEIVPGAIAISFLVLPFILAPLLPAAVAYFILAFNFYWFVKAINIMRHMINGFRHMWHDMKVDFLYRSKLVTTAPEKLLAELAARYEKTGKQLDYFDYLEIKNLGGKYENIKRWDDVYHVIFVTNYQEEYYITEPTFEAIKEATMTRKNGA